MRSLLRQLREAFPDAPLPPRPITEHRCPECDAADVLLGGQPWPEVAAGFPRECHHAFPLLTPAAQRYYLPAFMLSAFGSNGMQVDSLEAALTGGEFAPQSFTQDQRSAIGRWVVEYWGSWMGWEEPPPQLAAWWAEAGGSRAEPGNAG
ncbi:hypothetical protein GobsT_66230 [Gemmata obscuriglobus]|uniref:Uncharacterized protein n=1 Tax=Gemmata obscuriglobus TaxID=114 RepID=A0A2Z3GPH3_9BACT|nr:hypothetical protein [Gemmata obscuriglobus]AWM35693.1 hypothetical protein C1280_00745 [Gemmata obscuriglobus]QEG31779.1 hypothetical protein GobsT_66230 [Gemmata obscuriglobus]VTS11124.1 unnamed protein product [Gemmata obscuriglobus UQM 2246]